MRDWRRYIYPELRVRQKSDMMIKRWDGMHMDRKVTAEPFNYSSSVIREVVTCSLGQILREKEELLSLQRKRFSPHPSGLDLETICEHEQMMKSLTFLIPSRLLQ